MKERTPIFYMANLGSEVHRYFNFLQKNDRVAAQSAHQRSLDILKKILDFDSMKSRRDEIENLLPILENPSYLNSSLQETQRQLEEYFLPFSMKALSL